MKNKNFKFFIITFFVLSFIFVLPHIVKASGYDVCGNGTGWSFPESKAQTCGWGYWHEGGAKYGYVQDCCCCYLKSHVHDLGEIFYDKKVMIEYQPGWAKGCTDTMTVYASTDNQNWREITSHKVSQPTWNPKTTFQEKINVYGDFRYIKISIPHCYNDYSSARVLGDLSPPEDPIEGTLSVSDDSVCTGENITFTISAQDDQGIDKVCIKKEGGPETCKFCNGDTSCTKNITTSESNAGTYKFYGVLYGKKTDGSQEIGETDPSFLEITFNQCYTHDHKVCSNNDVYWANPCGELEDLYQDCGESGWTDDYRCSGNVVQRKWQNAGCENAQCTLSEEWRDIEDCSQEGKICQNGQCVPENNHPASGTLSASKTSLNTGENVDITIEGSDEDGLNSLCLFYDNDWHCQNVSGNSASYTWEVTESNAGDYNFCGKVKGKTPDGNEESVDTSPSCITITFNEGGCSGCNNNYYYYYYQNPNNHLGCYNNDVYWFDQYGFRKDKYQECGESYYSDWSEPYCKGNQVYKSRTYHQKGCNNGACYDNTSTEEKLIKTCSANQVCENGECKEKPPTNLCSSGPCCENGHYKPANTVCDVQFQIIYGCPWGTGCGYDVGERTRSRVRYCSGTSAQCDGKWGNWGPWTPWQVSDYCSYNEVCSVGQPSCQLSSACTASPSSYIKHYTKKCSGNSLYWVDSNGIFQDLYRNCSDDNSCTADSCQDGKCINNLHCDGSTCEIGSSDYCSSCNHCGDGQCNCGETEENCPQDCLLPTLCISGLAKKEGESNWSDNITIKKGEKINFMFSVCNSGEEPQNNIIFKVNPPKGISLANVVSINGNIESDVDLTKGISLGTLDPQEKETITFEGTVNDIEDRKELISGEIISGEKEKRAYISLLASQTAFSLLAAAIAGTSFLKWVLWFLGITIIILAIFLTIFFGQYIAKKRDEKRKQMILELIGRKK